MWGEIQERWYRGESCPSLLWQTFNGALMPFKLCYSLDAIQRTCTHEKSMWGNYDFKDNEWGAHPKLLVPTQCVYLSVNSYCKAVVFITKISLTFSTACNFPQVMSRGMCVCVCMCVCNESDKENEEGRLQKWSGKNVLVNVVCGVPASAEPFSSDAWRTELPLGRVPLAWCLKMEEESSSRVQPSR